MKGYIFITDDKIGESDFSVIAETMGAIGGEFVPHELYSKYQHRIQELYEEKGIANIQDFDFRIVLSDNSVLEPEGGIGITDSREYKEIYVESAGLPWEIILKIKADLS